MATHDLTNRQSRALAARVRRWRFASWAVAMLVLGLVPVVGLAAPGPEGQERLRARDLSVIEDLLSRTIQEAVQGTVEAINASNRQAQEEAAEQAGETPEIRYIFRSSGETLARGMFLEDYGVIFTVQVPTLSYNQAAMYLSLGDSDTWTVVSPGDSIIARELVREVQMRAQLNRMRAEFETMAQRVQQETQASGATSDSARKLRATLAQAEREYNAYADEVERQPRRNTSSETAEAGEPRRDRGTLGGGFPGLRIWSATDPEALARAKELADSQKTEVESAVIEAVVDTLASYGSVVHSLEETDRLAVVLLPSSYLYRIGPWLPATRRAEEFVISIRYGDIQALEDELITTEEFGSRIRVESRLGQPHAWRTPEPDGR